jgi:hypothetical protein
MMLQPSSTWPTGATISVGVFSAPAARARSADIVNLPPPSRVTLSEPEVTWAKAVRERLNHICALPVGWDGYGGRPTRFDAAEFAVQLLRRVCRPHTPAPAIVPLPSGGLQIEWHTSIATIELMIRAPYQVEAWVADPHVEDDGTEMLLSTDFTVIRTWVHKVGETIADQSAAQR